MQTAKRSVLIATNVIPEAKRVCDSLAVTADGRALVPGKSEKFLASGAMTSSCVARSLALRGGFRGTCRRAETSFFTATSPTTVRARRVLHWVFRGSSWSFGNDLSYDPVSCNHVFVELRSYGGKIYGTGGKVQASRLRLNVQPG